MYKRVVLATDLLVENDVLFDRAVSLTKEWGAELLVAHVVEPLPGYGYAYVGSADVEENLVKEAKAHMRELGEKYGISSDNMIVDIGPTKTEVVRLSDEHKADLIILGSHGRHGWSALLGSTASAVLHNANCDVLTVRIPDPT